MVRSRTDKALTPFSRDKLLVSVLTSLGHRSDKVTDASALMATLLPLIYKQQADAVIDALQLAQIVAGVLHNFDAAAEVYYRAYHHL
ncbi:MAG: hypothetical protein JWM37_8 [Candidatus Saccharibacteria bacterium]|nr:hypothetical protein [Candidatus Saccharibacteria bacterium]